MKKKIFLRTAALLLAVIFIIPSALCACDGDGGAPSIDDATLLSFKSAASYDYLKTLDGKKVTIKGWLATSSPVDGSFIFLMNMPYQSCPFCKPNTSQLSNTIEVFPKKGKKFEYTAEVVQIVGTLAVAEQNAPFTDKYGYEFNYKIVDAEYYLLDESELSGDLALWQKIANSNIVTDINKMFEYLNFVCNWCEYTAKFADGKDYLFPSDAERFIKTDGAQYNYGYKDGYFEGLVSKVLKIDTENLNDLINLILRAKELSEKALSDIENGKYSRVDEYTVTSTGTLIFGDGRKQYKMDDASIGKQNDALYTEFASWISSWEL